MPKKNTQPPKNLEIPKFIILTAKLFAFLSTKLVTRFAARLFVTPMKHKMPKREYEMYTNSTKLMITVPTINKKIMTYHYGNGNKKILLVHGWSGRGTQLCKLADELLKNDCATVSFDAPAHGKSPGNSTIMTEFIASIHEIDAKFGPFEAIVGHSLGGMSTLNAIKNGLQVKNATIIGSGDIVQDIIDDFIFKLQLHKKTAIHLKNYFEKKYGGSLDDFSAFKAASNLTLPILVIHDNDDSEVPASAGIHIHEYCKKGKLLLTNNLGHRKILGDKEVIQTTLQFIRSS
jgi:pimeloyl-ACP methyl ester carboxylesterase